MKQERQLLTIIISPSIEDIFVDWLLERPEIGAFNSCQIKSYRKDHQDYTLSELVTGWKRKIEIKVLLPINNIESFIEVMKLEFAKTGIYYRLTPFLDEGMI